jgi:hypothetical protein
MKKITYLILLSCISNFAKIKGTFSDEKGNPLPFVTIFSSNTYNGTTTNDNGIYELNIKSIGKHTIVFQYLGFKTQKIAIDIEKFPYQLNVKMIEENYTLNEVVINQKENPANAIIRSAIASKKENSDKTAKFKADFETLATNATSNLSKVIARPIDVDALTPGELLKANIDVLRLLAKDNPTFQQNIQVNNTQKPDVDWVEFRTLLVEKMRRESDERKRLQITV